MEGPKVDVWTYQIVNICHHTDWTNIVLFSLKNRGSSAYNETDLLLEIETSLPETEIFLPQINAHELNDLDQNQSSSTYFQKKSF